MGLAAGAAGGGAAAVPSPPAPWQRAQTAGRRGQLQMMAAAVTSEVLGEHLLQRIIEAPELRACQPRRLPARPHSRAEKALIRIDVAHAVEEFLVQERGFDRRLALVKERGKIINTHLQRLGAGPAELLLAHLQPDKSSRIDKAQFSD